MIDLGYLKYTRDKIHFTSRYQNGIVQHTDTIKPKKYIFENSSFKKYKKYFRNSSFNFAEKGATYYFESDECIDRYDTKSFNDIKRYLKPTTIAVFAKIHFQSIITPLGIFKASLHSYNMPRVRR